MQIHDWTRVDAGIFHDFHLGWIGSIRHVLNSGLLPDEYYALAEQFAGSIGPDVLTLSVPSSDEESSEIGEPEWTVEQSSGGAALAVEAAPPKVHLVMNSERDRYTAKQRTLVIRHTSDHRIVAILEIISPGNKSNRAAIETFQRKVVSTLSQGIQVLLLDLFPPTKRDPSGIHGLIWTELTGDAYSQPKDKPLTFVAYVSGINTTAYVEPLAVGDCASEMPLFLNASEYILVPLAATYQQAFEGVPRFYRNLLNQDHTS